MKKEKIIYLIGTAIGGGLIGFSANQLNTILGCIMFTTGICLLCFSSYKATKR